MISSVGSVEIYYSSAGISLFSGTVASDLTYIYLYDCSICLTCSSVSSTLLRCMISCNSFSLILRFVFSFWISFFCSSVRCIVFSFSVARTPGSPTTGSTLLTGPVYLLSFGFLIGLSSSVEVVVCSLG